MIEVTRLNGKRFIINAELIRTIEEKPDTIITLINGDHFVVREPMREVVEKCIEYGRHLRRLMPAA
ncbi:MAG: flagellar protein [Planctomycetota bacterium]|nr:MAG: flagellar protein [Planctomycetota bacterium]